MLITNKGERMKEIYDKGLNEKYLSDKRWKVIKVLIDKCKFNKANEILCQLRKSYGLKYR